MRQIPNGTRVPSGQKIWVSSAGPSNAVLQATAEATVPTGNVYLYDGNSSATDAQKLILSQTATLSTTVQATAEFLAPGSLAVSKTIAGPAAGSQGQVVIHVACNHGVVMDSPLYTCWRAAAPLRAMIEHIPAGTTRAVVETSNGSVLVPRWRATDMGRT